MEYEASISLINIVILRPCGTRLLSVGSALTELVYVLGVSRLVGGPPRLLEGDIVPLGPLYPVASRPFRAPKQA